MCVSNLRSLTLAVLCATFISGLYSQSYVDLEILGVNCPSRDKCQGYRNNLTYVDRSCECDLNCTAYQDCCIDAPPIATTQNSAPRARNDVKCLHYGEHQYTGVFVISKCSNSWNGPREVREKCVGRVDFTDPLVAAPVTDVARKKTYRNLACAECNNADLSVLKTFQVNLACDGLQALTEAQIIGDLTYNQRLRLWGINRFNRSRNGTEFIRCDIIFDVPGYLNNSVRFCRSNLISTCAANWTRSEVARLCSRYMTAVYSSSVGYKNPHCAICNHKTVAEISCRKGLSFRKRPMSFALLLDVNQSDGSNEVGMRRVATPQCPSEHKYDPFFKKCRRLVCALPGHTVVDGSCVRGG